MSEKSFFVYLLVSSDNATYVGATVDLNHRLRQHNKEIKGGAHATSSRVNKGHIWTRACHVAGFPDWPAALRGKFIMGRFGNAPGNRTVIGNAKNKATLAGQKSRCRCVRCAHDKMFSIQTILKLTAQS
jgi:hypothetical protein